MDEKNILRGYEYAKEVYLSQGVNVDAAIRAAKMVPVSMHCWQGDDLHGFDGGGLLTGGIQATGNYPGCARTAAELRMDIEKAFSLIPGAKKLNLHASYAETEGRRVGRDEIMPREFSGWIAWAKAQGVGLDFNPTFFSHPMMDGNFSLSSRDSSVRNFWIEHGRRCREIGLAFGKELGKTSVVNYWMPDGYKDIPVDTKGPRQRMAASLDEIFRAPMDEAFVRESVESKLFGIGIESYTVVNHEFALGYAATRGKLYCMDAGHFHPTEVLSDKLSSVLMFVPGVMLHISRGVRWDSDHVVLFDDELKRLLQEVVQGGYLDRVYIGQDYFDASINRIAAWVIGMRNTQKALLHAFLRPAAALQSEEAGDYSARLAQLEEVKTLPFSAIWDYYCLTEGVPAGPDWIGAVKCYEADVLSKR